MLIDCVSSSVFTHAPGEECEGNAFRSVYGCQKLLLRLTQCNSIPGISDHDIVLTESDFKAKINKKAPHKIHLWAKADWDNIRSKTHIFSNNFLDKFNSRTVEQNYQAFSNHIKKVIIEHVPSKMTSSRTNLPWFTNTLKRMCKKKQRLYNKAKKDNNNGNWLIYKSFKSDTLKAIRKARWDYINDKLQIALEQGDPGPFWQYIRSQKQDNVGISPLQDGGKLHTDSMEKAEILSNQFKSVFTQEDTTVIPHLHGPEYPTISILEVTPIGVTKLLNAINPKKAQGPDEIPCRILRELDNELTPALTAIFNQSLKTGELPLVWNEAIVTPIYKKGDRNLPVNYRPISLTCVCCKILEHIICTHIRHHLDTHNILSKLQHGFRSKHSCVSQLTITINDLLKHRDKRTQIDMAILDFSKAFDTVPHQRLLGKLSFYGIKGPLLNWIAAFLKDRQQRVVVEGMTSGQVPVDSGVQQGSVLGPLLFLLHINDLPNVVTSQVRLFADDCLLYRPIRSVVDQEGLQCDLEALEQWATSWGMRFNAKKCYLMNITRTRNHLTHNYSLNNHTLQTVTREKYLGITISNDLNWSTHINTIYIYNSILIWGLTILKSGARTPRTVTKFAVKTAIDLTQKI